MIKQASKVNRGTILTTQINETFNLFNDHTGILSNQFN